MNNEMENNILTFQDEDGNDVELEIIDAFEISETQYVALVSVEEPAEDQEEEVFIMRIEEDENGDEVLLTIEDDEEFDRVADAFEDEFMSEIDHDSSEEDAE